MFNYSLMYYLHLNVPIKVFISTLLKRKKDVP